VKAAIVEQAGRKLVYGDFKEPVPSAGENRIAVAAAYLWGESAECLLTAGSKAGTGAPTSFIQIGTAGGMNITLPGAILRSTPIELMGSGIGSVPINRIVGAIEQVLRAAVVGHFEIATKPIALSEIEQAWSSDGYMPRAVFTIGNDVPQNRS
jgi:hypothetical protein